MTRAADRFFGLALLILAGAFAGGGWGLKVPFSYDPLGPRPYPLLLAGILALVALWLVLKPQEVKLPLPRVLAQGGLMIAGLLCYQMTFRWLGFILSTLITVVWISRLFKGSWLQGLMAGLGLALACYGLFDLLLEIPLPAGTLFTGSGG